MLFFSSWWSDSGCTLYAVAAAAAAVAWAVVYCVQDYRKYSSMPGLGRYWPVVGHLPTIAANYERLPECLRYRFEELGWPPYVVFKGGVFEPGRYVFIGAADIECMLKTKFDSHAIAVGARGEASRDFFGDGIFNVDGHKWLTQRKLASREFNANRFRGLMSDTFNKYSQRLVTVLDHAVGSHAVVDIHELLFTLTLDAFGEIAFGVDIGGLTGAPQNFARAFDLCTGQTLNRIVAHKGWQVFKALNLGPERRMAESVKIVNDFVDRIIDTHLSRSDRPPAAEAAPEASVVQKEEAREEEEEEESHVDLLQRLLPVAKLEDGTYNRKLVRDMVLNLIIAGRDTTASSMAWVLYELMRHPELVPEILEELDAHVGPDMRPAFDSVADCHYMQAVLNETQRLHPAVPFDPKTVVKPVDYPCGARLRPGDVAAHCNYAIGWNPNTYGADCKQFNVQRWLNADGTCKREDPFRFPAFNAGRRMCLGIDMANLEMKVVLATLLRAFRFELEPGQTIIPGLALILQMRDGMKVRVHRRQGGGK